MYTNQHQQVAQLSQLKWAVAQLSKWSSDDARGSNGVKGNFLNINFLPVA